MRVVRETDEDEMILAFLRAELGSPRWSPFLTSCLQTDGLDLIRDPDLNNHEQKQRRNAVLSCYRGYASRTLLFEGFPQAVAWKLLEVTVEELGAFRYGTLLTHSTEPLLVRQAAADLGSIADDLADNILSLEATDPRESPGLDQPIIVASRGPQETHVLLEGYSRATVYVRQRVPGSTLDVIAGYATDLDRWRWY
jgi:hypothetical protein